jgi:hypothetical protein
VRVNPNRPAPRIFLIERYLPVTRVDDLAAAVLRVEQVCAAHRAAGLDLHYLHSTFLPAEDTCFCVFQGPSAEAVQAVNETAGLVVDRIRTAVRLDTRATAPLRPRPSRRR